MEGGNQSRVSEFILLGLSEQPEQERIRFLLFLFMYLISGLGNLLIMMAIYSDPHLHTPMYFFLSNLSLVDICFTSTTVPRMLNNYVSKNRTIQYAECLTQVFFLLCFAGMDCVLLAIMAYDRYVAICAPLHYNTVMTPKVCARLVAVSWFWACNNALTNALFLTRLSFCGHNEIPNFFCDLSPLLKLACSDTFINDMLIYTMGALTTFLPFIGILISYIHIFMAVLKISSVSGKQKVFSTCGSHLTVVCLFYGTIIGVYFSPTSTHTAQQDIAATVMYTMVTPMLNPFIYSLRNKDMKGALRMLITRRPGFTL
ncbi:olfactory receptor 1f45-like [Notamacropus eugenii]|uniref:olfactory receptor 1f45-like n=1 Tax=Notamacropus eugenii TaxID=9315 RepID=UPI003B682543